MFSFFLRWGTVSSALVILGCGSEQSGAPNMVGVSWEMQVGGVGEPPRGGTEVSFDGLQEVDIDPDPRYQGPRNFFGHGQPFFELAVEGETTLTLPAPAASTADQRAAGVKLVGMTYCGFVNSTEEPRSADIGAVSEAMEMFLDAVGPPLRNASLTDEGLEEASELAAARLRDSVRRRWPGPDSELNTLAALEGRYVSSNLFPFGGPFDFNTLANFLPSLVWIVGDDATRASLSGCGVFLLFDTPTVSLSGFLWDECLGVGVYSQTMSCSLEAFRTRSRGDTAVRIAESAESPFRVHWRVVPEVTLTPLLE